jgi:hypothetical protein
MENLEAFGDMLGRHHAGADMLRRPRHAGIHGVDIEIVPCEHVARRDRALIEMDMLALIDDAGAVIEIDQHGIAVAAGLDIDDMDGRPRGPEIDLVAPGLHIVLAIAAIEHEIAGTFRKRVLDERARQAQAAMLAHDGALGCQDLDAGGDSLAEADLLEEVECRLMDALHVALAQGLVLPALHAGAHRCLFARDGPGSQRLARLASAAPA